jgi:hypothetical protein
MVSDIEGTVDDNLDRIRRMMLCGEKSGAIEEVETLFRQLVATEILLQEKVEEVGKLRRYLGEHKATTP